MGIKKGTKLTDNPKEYILRVRMDKTTLAKLDAICKEQDVTRSQVIRNWIVEQYQGKKQGCKCPSANSRTYNPTQRRNAAKSMIADEEGKVKWGRKDETRIRSPV